jgi:pyruvate carboxylase
VKALKEEIGIPIHFHTHDTSGINAASLLRAADAGVDIVDGALASMSGMTSQPNLNAMVAAIAHTERDAELDSDTLNRMSDYWEAVREQYYPFEEGMKAPTAEVYHHEMPGGQYTNLRQQAKSMGLESRWHDIADTYAEVNKLFGDIVKVTPSSKVVGDLALFIVTNGLTALDVLSPEKKLNFPKSVVEMMQGQLGFPEGGWPKVLQKIVLDSAGAKPIKGRSSASMPPADFDKEQKDLEKKVGHKIDRDDLLSYLLYPEVFLKYDKFKQDYSDVSVLPTPPFFYGLKSGEEITVEIESGKTLIIKFLTASDPHPDGTRTLFF